MQKKSTTTILHASTIHSVDGKVLFDCDVIVRDNFINVTRCAYAVNDTPEECNTWYNSNAIASIYDVSELETI